MAPTAAVSFFVEEFGSYQPAVHAVVPLVNGTALTDLVSAFEGEHGYEPVGGYGGLIPEFFKYGSLDRYFMGEFEPDSYWTRLGGLYVLGCDCGEVGCWPLLCQVSREGNAVVWDQFRQPHRKDRDYSQFGPFVFDAVQYLVAVKDLQARCLAQTASGPASSINGKGLPT
jgi:hypothetical protein